MHAGRVHVEWDATAPITPFGRLPFFIDYLKPAGFISVHLRFPIRLPAAPSVARLAGG